MTRGTVQTISIQQNPPAAGSPAAQKPNRDSLTCRLISGRDFFVAVGISFTDADLESLLPVLPSP